jgi:molybdopterin converting factor small subunit
MEVKVKIIGVSKDLPGFERQKEAPVGFSGNSVKDLIQQILSTMDPENRKIFLSGRDEIPLDLAIIVNGLIISDSSRFNLRLKDGDLVEFVSSPG